MSKISGDINQEMVRGCETIESLREQLSVAASEILALRTAERLAEANAEIARLKANSVKRTHELLDGIIAQAASQLRERQLREALAVVNNAGDDEWYPYTPEQAKKAISEALDTPTDTSALEAVVAKAGEVMRERCADTAEDYNGKRGEHDGSAIAHLIRAIPAVTLEDLRSKPR